MPTVVVRPLRNSGATLVCQLWYYCGGSPAQLWCYCVNCGQVWYHCGGSPPLRNSGATLGFNCGHLWYFSRLWCSTVHLWWVPCAVCKSGVLLWYGGTTVVFTLVCQLCYSSVPLRYYCEVYCGATLVCQLWCFTVVSPVRKFPSMSWPAAPLLLHQTYSWPSLVVPYSEEPFSRPFLGENCFWLVLGAQTLLEN